MSRIKPAATNAAMTLGVQKGVSGCPDPPPGATKLPGEAVGESREADPTLAVFVKVAEKEPSCADDTDSNGEMARVGEDVAPALWMSVLVAEGVTEPTIGALCDGVPVVLPVLLAVALDVADSVTEIDFVGVAELEGDVEHVLEMLGDTVALGEKLGVDDRLGL